METKDWLSIATTAADIAIKLLPLFTFPAKAATAATGQQTSDPFIFGPTKWHYLSGGPVDNVLMVENNSDETIALTFSESLSFGPISTFFILGPGAAAPVDSEFREYTNGELCISRVTSPVAETTDVVGPAIQKAIAFSITSLAAGVTYNLFTGYSLVATHDQNKWSLSLFNHGTPVDSGTLKVDANDGKQSVRLEADLKKKTSETRQSSKDGIVEQYWSFDLVGSELLDPIALNLYATLTIPVQIFDERVGERLYLAEKSS